MSETPFNSSPQDNPLCFGTNEYSAISQICLSCNVCLLCSKAVYDACAPH